ncbi:MAG: hypothetical protein BV458_03945 [Thermoplasmata archaeon M9B2D]|nr:MAG: hypothetical protein BV458_03945 [Thermoplasmata archaeon M9B2D]
MPSGDRTGPWGLGPRTGRAAGYCTEYNVPGYANPAFGRWFGRCWGRGFGRGFWGRARGYWGRGVYPNPAPYYPEPHIEPSREEEKTYLENMIKGLEEELKLIQERLQELSKEKKEAP